MVRISSSFVQDWLDSRMKGTSRMSFELCRIEVMLESEGQTTTVDGFEQFGTTGTDRI